MPKVFSSIPEQQIKFLQEVFQINSESWGLDIGCGSGYHLLELQKISNNIHGLDINALDVPNFIQGNIFEIDLEFKNDLDFAYTLAPYFDQDWNRLEILVQKLGAYLKPDALFLLDLFNFNSLKDGMTKKDWEIMQNRVILKTYKKIGNTYTGKTTIKFKDWSEKEVDLYWRIFEEEELQVIAFKNGFKIVKLYSDFNINKVGEFNPVGKFQSLQVLFQKI